MLSFLIDECCSPDLVAEALARGQYATHINYLGLSGRPDRELVAPTLAGDYLFVTNNRRDFLRLYAELEVHPGLVIIIPSVATARQVELFVCALDAIASRFDTINQLIEVDAAGVVTMSAWPFAGNTC